MKRRGFWSRLCGFRLDAAVRIEEPSDGRTDFPGLMGGVSVVPGVYGCCPKNRGTNPQNGWFGMENLIEMDDLGVPLFLETSTWDW